MDSNRAPTGTLSHELAVDRRLLTVSKPSVEWPFKGDFEFSRQRQVFKTVRASLNSKSAPKGRNTDGFQTVWSSRSAA